MEKEKCEKTCIECGFLTENDQVFCSQKCETSFIEKEQYVADWHRELVK